MTTIQNRPTDHATPHHDGVDDTIDDAIDEAVGRPWLIVAVREIAVRLTNRAFLISTLLTLVLIGGFAAFSAWQAGKTTTYTVAVSTADGSRLVEQAAAKARNTDAKVVISPTTVSGREAAKAGIDRGDIDAWLHETTSG